MDDAKTVSIKLKVAGVEVELQCLEDQVERVVQDVLKGMRSSSEAVEGLKATRQMEATPRTCREIIEELYNERWFSEARPLNDVWEELGRRGFHYDRSAVSHALLDLTKEGVLSRLGKARKYRYIQKTPRKLEIPNIDPDIH
ncbi:MAG: hypothetical protein GTN80_00910 [Nitrososphaeria archaeon]|nr:hypothetical protein [Nitrososphaeria archaeon]NIQ32205.1 hypothetical protein [Nitrososphaeria archaeon]